MATRGKMRSSPRQTPTTTIWPPGGARSMHCFSRPGTPTHSKMTGAGSSLSAVGSAVRTPRLAALARRAGEGLVILVGDAPVQAGGGCLAQSIGSARAVWLSSSVGKDGAGVPDFVDVVIQSYRHRYAYAAGDPALLDIEARLQAQPEITVPTINLHGEGDGVGPAPRTDHSAPKFKSFYERRLIPRIGHNVPQEAPAETVSAILDLMKETLQ